MESSEVLFAVIWMESVKVFYFNCKFILIEHMCILCIACLNESNLWMFPLFAYMCFSCGDPDSVQVALVKFAQSVVALFKYRTYISTCFCHYYLSAYKHFHSDLLSIYQLIGLPDQSIKTVVNADVIIFIIIPVGWFRKKNRNV